MKLRRKCEICLKVYSKHHRKTRGCPIGLGFSVLSFYREAKPMEIFKP